MASDRDWYRVLGVRPWATAGEIKRAFRRLALKYHPDTFQGDKKAAERLLAEILEAYEVLSDPGKRLIYDRESGFRTREPAPRPWWPAAPRAQEEVWESRYHNPPPVDPYPSEWPRDQVLPKKPEALRRPECQARIALLLSMAPFIAFVFGVSVKMVQLESELEKQIYIQRNAESVSLHLIFCLPWVAGLPVEFVAVALAFKALVALHRKPGSRIQRHIAAIALALGVISIAAGVAASNVLWHAMSHLFFFLAQGRRHLHGPRRRWDFVPPCRLAPALMAWPFTVPVSSRRWRRGRRGPGRRGR
jgi:hypothetical protein